MTLSGRAPVVAAWVALYVGLFAIPSFAQNTEAPSQPPTKEAKHELDLNDPRVIAAISEAMKNPISELIAVWTQFDTIRVHFPATSLYDEQDHWAYRFQFMPTFSVSLGERATWVSRLDVPVVSLPIKSEVGKLFQLDPGNNMPPDDTLPADLDPFGRTTGLGDLVYLGLVGPKKMPEIGGGKLFLAAGPSLIFPSASSAILGQGKWQAGPALAAGFLSEHLHIGILPQQWWSFAGDGQRRSVSQLSLQYFLYYAPTPEWQIGMSPVAFVNWNAPSNNQVTFPVGLGVYHLFNIGQLPISAGVEASYAVVHPEDLPGGRWDFRVTLMPLLPAPWGHLAKELRALQQSPGG